MMKFRCLVVVAAGLFAAACSGDPCSYTSPCSADPVPSQADRTTCKNSLNAQKNAECYNEGVDYLDCSDSQTVCGADNKTDTANTAVKITNNCKSQQDKYVACCATNTSSTACGGAP